MLYCVFDVLHREGYTFSASMNESIFFLHIFLVVGSALFALRLGKEALFVFVALQVICANLFVVKQMRLFGCFVTCSDVFAVGAILGSNLIQEYYGRAEARRSIWISFGSMFFFMAMSYVHLAYMPLFSDRTHEAFSLIFSHSLRIVLASISVYAFVQFLDVSLFGWFKSLLKQKYLPLRIGMSLVITQGIDTVLFSFLGLYGIVISVLDVMIVSFFVKCVIIGLGSPLTAFSRKVVKHVQV